MDSLDSSAAALPPQPHQHQQQLHGPPQNITMGPPQEHFQHQPPSHPNYFPFQKQQSLADEVGANKKKRGRPRKIHPGGSAAGADTFSSEAATRKHRGRPLAAPGISQLSPHVITVKADEDIYSKLMAFSQEGPSTICILSANGSVCTVTIRQPGSGVTVSYEGKFEILKLTGSFSVSDNNGTRVRSGALSVSLVGADGITLGGVVAGVLKAASPVQIVVGSFIHDAKKPRSSSYVSPAAAITIATDDTTPPSQGGSNDASEDDGDVKDGGSPTDEGGAQVNNSIEHINWDDLEIIRC